MGTPTGSTLIPPGWSRHPPGLPMPPEVRPEGHLRRGRSVTMSTWYYLFVCALVFMLGWTCAVACHAPWPPFHSHPVASAWSESTHWWVQDPKDLGG